MQAKSKFNSVETLISQALIDMDISHEEFITILNEKDKCEKMKDNENEKSYEIMTLSSVKSKTYKNKNKKYKNKKILSILYH